jgi:hypothetical protein
MITRRPVLIGLASYLATSLALLVRAAAGGAGPFA